MGNTNKNCTHKVQTMWSDNRISIKTQGRDSSWIVHKAAEQQDAVLLLRDLLDGCHATAAEWSAQLLPTPRTKLHMVVCGASADRRLDVQLHGVPGNGTADYDAVWRTVQSHLETRSHHWVKFLNIDAIGFAITDVSPSCFDTLLAVERMGKLRALRIRGLPMRLRQIFPISLRCPHLDEFRASVVGPPNSDELTPPRRKGVLFDRITTLKLEWWLPDDRDVPTATVQCARATFATVINGRKPGPIWNYPDVRSTTPVQTLQTLEWTVAAPGTGPAPVDWPLLPTVQALLPADEWFGNQLRHVRIRTGSTAHDAVEVAEHLIVCMQCLPTEDTLSLERTVEIVVPRGCRPWNDTSKAAVASLQIRAGRLRSSKKWCVRILMSGGPGSNTDEETPVVDVRVP